MAREEQDREDILKEATALVDRGEMRFSWLDETFVFGFRRDDSLSLFFGPDEVYQFNTRHELRRGYLNGRLVKADRGHLVYLRRLRTDHETQLLREVAPSAEQDHYLRTLGDRLDQLQHALVHHEGEMIGQVTQGTESPRDRLVAWLAARPSRLRLAESPRVS